MFNYQSENQSKVDQHNKTWNHWKAYVSKMGKDVIIVKLGLCQTVSTLQGRTTSNV